MSVSVVYPNKDFIYLYARLNWTNIKQDYLSSLLTKVYHYFYKVLISNCKFEITTTETQTWLQLSRQKIGSHLLMDINKKITFTQHHHKLIFHSSCHVPRVLVVASKVEQGTIRVGNKRILVMTCALTATTVTQRSTSCH